MKTSTVVVLLAAGLLAGCVGGTTKLRYTEMPEVNGSPSAAGLAIVDCELGLQGYKPNALDPATATSCWIVREGAGEDPVRAQDNFGVFVFQDLRPGRYAVTKVEWNTTIWIEDARDADARESVDRTADEVPHDCKFVYTFSAWESPQLTFDVEPGSVVYKGVMTIDEPAQFELRHGERPPTTVERDDYSQNVTFQSLASYEKRVLEELYRKNTTTEWGDVIQRRIKELEE